jgi:signal transduction histidine kinase
MPGAGLPDPVLQVRNRRLLFRSYLTLAGGLLAAAILLDLGFGYLQTRQQPDSDRWLAATFQLIEERLAEAPAAERESLAASLSADLGVGVQLLPRDAVVFNDTIAHRTTPLVDADGATSYLHDADAIDAVVRLGPIPDPEDSWLLNLLPPLFYLSILVVVGFWLRPLLRDIDVISGAAQRFAADYREPLATAGQATELKGLAGNLDDMAAKLSGVLKSQKELIAALSHEMRTPLARIRFALALDGERADPDYSDRLAAINDDVQEIDALITSMLSYARLDHPDIRMHWQAVPVKPWLERIVAKMASGNIRIRIRTEELCGEAWMDSKLMDLALSNLLVNALRYAVQDVRCSLVPTSGGYWLCVEDDGPGIPNDARDSVFRAFTRIDDSRSRDTGGSGLGLAVVARVAELHGGAAAVDASPELGGARFSMRWPAPERPDG